MSPWPTKSNQLAPHEAQSISKWTRAYAQNRGLGAVLFMIVFVVLFAAIAGGSYFAGEAYRSGNTLLFWALIPVLVLASAAVIYFSIPVWGGKLMERMVQRLYAKEGNVALSAPGECKKSWGLVLGGCFGVCIIASVVVSFVVDIPAAYMQPISALYVVPFLVGLWLLMRPMVGFPALLWPILYAAHAILTVAGVPILFTGRPWEGLNMVIPVMGYGLLTGVVQHLYSRVMLGRLKQVAQSGVDPSDKPSS